MKIVLTLEDNAAGNVDVDVEFTPDYVPGKLTPAAHVLFDMFSRSTIHSMLAIRSDGTEEVIIEPEKKD